MIGRLLRHLGLSARLLVLTVLFVMIAEVLIYVPSIANFRLTWLNDKLAAAQIAALVLDASPEEGISEELEMRLLEGVGLGLSIASELVGLHGGTITLDRSAIGTRFRVTIPDRAATEAAI